MQFSVFLLRSFLGTTNVTPVGLFAVPYFVYLQTWEFYFHTIDRCTLAMCKVCRCLSLIASTVFFAYGSNNVQSISCGSA